MLILYDTLQQTITYVIIGCSSAQWHCEPPHIHCAPITIAPSRDSVKTNQSLKARDVFPDLPMGWRHGSPLPVSETGTRFVKDANGWVHFMKDDEEAGCHHVNHQRASTPMDRSLSDVLNEYERRASEWRQSAQCGEIISILREGVMEEEGLVIDACICAALGTFSGEHPYCPGDKSMDQLMLLETVLEVLRECCSNIDLIYVCSYMYGPIT